MKFVKGILLLQLSAICQALLNSTTQVPPTNSSVLPDGNFTQFEEDINDTPYIELLSGKCHWTLKMSKNSPIVDVAVDVELADRLALQICQDLGCGQVYNMKKIKYPSNSSCLSEYQNQMGRLQNCSFKEVQDCVVISEALCGAHMVRLSEGKDRCAGRVELWREDQWGSVCDDHFDLKEAQVVCTQIGCGYALNVSGQVGLFPPGRAGPVLLDDLNCTGTEPNLWDCPATENVDCGHKEDAGVVCSEMKAVRLSGGLDHCSGKVEIHRNGTWGTVCDTCWNRDLASMICSMLQCDPDPQNFTQFNPPLSHNPGPLYYYHCPPSSSATLWDCREIFNRPHLCKNTNAAGVICRGSLGFPVTTTDKSDAKTTGKVTDATTAMPGDSSPLLSVPVLALASVSLLLLVFLIVNTVLCCHFKSRHAFMVQQSHKSQSNSKQRRNSYKESVDLTKITTNPGPNHDSQRHRDDRNPLMRPLDLNCLHEEASEPVHGEVGAFLSCNGADFRPMSQITSNSFDTSSTSSDETYKNTTPHSEWPPYKEKEEEEEGPVYSPVSPETDTSSEEDYDDVA
ncbi:deleted in malignant brain tumors 1 protein-like isoform X2 [Periophthalmus magnuspinnatus]|uniref:deleted in malignant brain tumors 1 protein-like isoform X2 n=1 Tax=Periophthalmus magnuspinnatus TaxID=409849 RepID=UPI002436CCC8|nr:deleted in malignant brain tumors 1 protein-like isoform X2 [Periophthalmus magnuspinnatus]